MKKAFIITIVTLLITVFSLSADSSFVTASSLFDDRPEPLPSIIIASDGSVSPSTDLIKRNGNTYTLTNNALEKPIMIKRDNAIFDGTGYNITVSTGPNPALRVDADNVAVKNVCMASNNIYTLDLHCSGGLIENVQTNKALRTYGNANKIDKCDIGNFCIFQGKDNVITKCNIYDILISGRSNLFFANNFFLSTYPHLIMESIWDNGSIGNYWANYSVRYPDALEIANTGIANTPYTIERDEISSRTDPDEDNNVDHFPLLYPYDIDKDQIAFPSPTPSIPESSYLPPNDRNALHLDPIYYLIPISVIVAIVVLSVLLFRRHRKKADLKQ